MNTLYQENNFEQECLQESTFPSNNPKEHQEHIDHFEKWKLFRASRNELFSKQHKILMNKIQEVNFLHQDKDIFLKIALEALGHGESQSFKLSWTTKIKCKGSLPSVWVAPSWRRKEDEEDFSKVVVVTTATRGKMWEFWCSS